ncbi:hypothetical protein AB3329_10495 [Streptococcus sp. H31]|uniref:hypothetical protein n=1 Tax=Streptococcus huangxiaojuni TaxID=3237239 RepID=UPI0034A35A4B
MNDTKELNDYDRYKLAAEEYTDYKKEEKLTFTNFEGKEQAVGTVRNAMENKMGLKADVARKSKTKIDSF